MAKWRSTFPLKGLFKGRPRIKARSSWPILVWICFNFAATHFLSAQQAPAQQAPALTQTTNSAPAAQPSAVPPPSAPAQRSKDDLEKLVAPIALYPDTLIASLLPASAYPLEVVQAARFVKDTNNIAKLDAQPWDDNVKAVARFPQVIAQMDENIQWTSDLGDAFINQPKELMDAIQTMRSKAKDSGALKTTPEQVVNVSETVVTNVVEQQTVYVTNQVVQIQPAQSQVIYVPQYNPTVVYAGYPVAYPGYYYPPPPAYYPGAMAAASIVSFGAGMAMGAWLANDCDWDGGGCYHSDVNVNRDVNRNVNRNTDRSANAQNRTENRQTRTQNRTENRQTRSQNRGEKWQPDQNRLKNSGSALSSTQSREARGWNTANTASRQAGAGTTRAEATSQRAQGRTSTGQGGANSTRSASTRTPSGSTRTPSATGRSSATATGRSASGANARASSTGGRSSQSVNRPSSSSRGAFNSSGGAAQARQSSARGASSRSSGGGSRGGGGGGRGGGGRGGGGRR